MRLDRSTLLGVVLGVLLLVGITGFAVALPGTVDGDVPNQSSARLPVDDLLPPSLMSGRLAPVGDVFPDGAAANEDAEQQTVARLEQLFDDEAAFGFYSTKQLDPFVSLTIIDRPAGVFLPDGPPEPPAAPEDRAGTNEMVRFGEVICAVSWGSEAETSKTGLPAKVQCQREYDDRTFDLYTRGLGADQSAAIVNEAVGHAQSIEGQDQ